MTSTAILLGRAVGLALSLALVFVLSAVTEVVRQAWLAVAIVWTRSGAQPSQIERREREKAAARARKERAAERRRRQASRADGGARRGLRGFLDDLRATLDRQEPEAETEPAEDEKAEPSPNGEAKGRRVVGAIVEEE